MSAADRLRALADNATEPQVGGRIADVARRCEARENIAALAPDLAKWAADAAEALRDDASYIAAVKTGRHGPDFRACLCVRCKSDQRELDRIGVVLARLAAIVGEGNTT